MSAARDPIAAIAGRLRGHADRLSTDSRRVSPGTAFVAYPGETRDGRAFVPEAIARGATAVAWEPDGWAWDPAWAVENVAVSGLRELAGPLASAFNGEPSRRMKVIGVTGTNGKTTCTFAIASCLVAAGVKTAVVGTVGNGYPGALEESGNTTPDAVVLQEMLAAFVNDGAGAVAMEVSSHGLVQGRVNGTAIHTAVFTNLTRDHLDYHGDMAAYAAAKERLFAFDGLRHSVIHADDAHAARMVAAASASGSEIWLYGIGGNGRGPGIWATNEAATARGVEFDVSTPWGAGRVTSPMVGRFNILNLLAVLSVVVLAGVPFERALGLVGSAEPPPGRMQRVGGGGRPLVVVDYAHSPDALENVLTTLRPALPAGGRLWCVFGCGGDRDRGKRPLMGAVAARLADEVVLTSDNPRTEAPESILRDIAAGIPGRRYTSFVDRAEAIRSTLASAGADDIVLLAGKGHENYQEVAGVRRPFSDLERAGRALAEVWGHADGQ